MDLAKDSKDTDGPEPDLKKTSSESPWRIRIAFIAFCSIASVICTIGFRDAYQSRKEQKYAASHLEENAVTKEEFKFVQDGRGHADYGDPDKDGKYGLVYHRLNFKGHYIDIPVKKNPEGRFVFPTLDDKALTPLDALWYQNPPGSPANYIPYFYYDVDDDSLLESIVFFGAERGKSDAVVVEKNEGFYHFHNSDP